LIGLSRERSAHTAELVVLGVGQAGVPIGPVACGASGELGKSVGEKGKGITAIGVGRKSSDQPVVELEPRKLRGLLNDRRQVVPTQWLDGENLLR
jgi:hypothetical protein